MPDRAVVELACQNCGTHLNVHSGVDIVRCPQCRVRFHADDLSPWGCHAGDNDEAPQPRAMSAVSEDRQWLVVLQEGTLESVWYVFRSKHVVAGTGRVSYGPYEYYALADDTGQDAHEVLRDWLAGQKGREG